MKPAVVPALKDDVPGILALHREGLRHYTWAWDHHYVSWSVSRGYYYVMRYRREIIGAIKVRVEHNYIWVCTIAVSAKYRGQGLGRKLINFAKRYARRYGFRKLKLDTLSVSRADKFYTRLGFVRTYDGHFRGCRYRMYDLAF